MNCKIPLAGCVFLVAASLLVSTPPAGAFTLWIGPTNGLWNTSTNWDDGIPDAQDAEAVFNGAASVDVDAATVTVGTIVMTAAGTNDAVTISNGTVNMDVSFGTPAINVGTASGNSLFMYANVTGAGGLRKDGPGKFTFRFNTNNQTYSGGIFLNGGTFGINQAGSMGDADNDVNVEASSVFRFEPGSDSGSITLGAGHDVILSSGTILTIQNSGSNTVSSTINGAISGDGNLTFSGSGTLTLGGTVGHTGDTTVTGGTLALGAGVTLPTNTLTMSGTSTAFNAGGNTQHLNVLALQTDTNQARAFTFTNGTVQLGAGTGNFAFNGAQGTTANFAGLSAFTYTAPNRTFLVQPSANNGSNNTNFVLLAATAAGSNNITAAGLTVGGAASGAGTANGSQLTLGRVNVLNVTNFNVGGFNASGVVDVASGVTNASLTIRSTDGTSAAGTIKVGETSSGSRNGSGALNLGGGSLDLVATNVQVGRHVAGANNAETSVLTFGGGSVVVTNLTLAEKTGTGTPVITATVNQSGGTVGVALLTMGVGSPTNALPRLLPTYYLSGGTLKAGTIAAGFGIAGTNFATNTVRRINWTGGTIRPLAADTNLLISGTAGTGGLLDIPTIGPATKTFAADGTNGISLSSTTWLIANGGDILVDPGTNGTFSTTGGFTIGSGNYASTNATFTNAANASITVASGTANLATDARIFGIGDRTVAGVTNAFNVNGGAVNLGLTVNRMLVGNRSIGQVNVNAGSLVITGNQPVYIGGDFSFGTTGARGSLNIASAASVSIGGSGSVILGQANTNGTSTDIEGAINLNGGSLTTARPISAAAPVGTNVSSGTVNFNGGVFAAGAGVANILNVTTATVSSNGLTYDTGTFDSGMTQNLAGAGTLTVAGTGMLRLNGTNTPPVVVTNGATLGGIGSAGTVTANGTFAPGAPATNGTFTVTSSLIVPGTARFRVFGNAINDRVIASGGATLGGTVAVVVDTNYTPASGDSFDLVEGVITGTPALSLPALGGGLTWLTNDFLSTGVLAITNGGPVDNYADWVAYWTNAVPGFTNTAAGADPDGDSFNNGKEFAFDGNPTVGNAALLKAAKIGTNAVFSWVQRNDPPGGVTYSVQATTNLAAGPWTNASVTVTNSGDQTGINIPADYTRKEFAVPATGSDFYRIEAVVSP